MAQRVTGRNRVVVARSLHPEYRQVLETYTRNLGLRIHEIGFNNVGQVDANRLEGAINSDTAAVVVQSPNFFGVLEQTPQLASLAHPKGALLVVSVTEGVSLGAVRPPVEADIVALETQSFGLPQSYGGPYAGVIATREKFVRQMPGRLAGETVDSRGRRGYVLTLATREQHIRREKATSNICTNQALCALAVNIHLCLLGKEGLKELAAQNLAKARFALEELEKIRGVRRAFSAPFFNEFVVEFPRSVKLVNAELLKHKIIGPLPIGSYFADLTKRGLFCVTETVSRAEIERMAEAVRDILAKPI
jgi:glycine dehydrogenase subunit 1